jgi:hypothetical protein
MGIFCNWGFARVGGQPVHWGDRVDSLGDLDLNPVVSFFVGGYFWVGVLGILRRDAVVGFCGLGRRRVLRGFLGLGFGVVEQIVQQVGCLLGRARVEVVLGLGVRLGRRLGCQFFTVVFFASKRCIAVEIKGGRIWVPIGAGSIGKLLTLFHTWILPVLHLFLIRLILDQFVRVFKARAAGVLAQAFTLCLANRAPEAFTLIATVVPQKICLLLDVFT